MTRISEALPTAVAVGRADSTNDNVRVRELGFNHQHIHAGLLDAIQPGTAPGVGNQR